MGNLPEQSKASDPERVIIVELGAEGGSVKVCGSCVDGSWSFWQERVSMTLDENDEESWNKWTTEKTSDLLTALPTNWVALHPIHIHTDFSTWFRAHYEAACDRLPESLRLRYSKTIRIRWRKALDGAQSVA